jgi:hypothetical protein
VTDPVDGPAQSLDPAWHRGGSLMNFRGLDLIFDITAL